MLNININNYFYNYVLEIIYTTIFKSNQITIKETHKHIYIVKFDSKASEALRLSKSL